MQAWGRNFSINVCQFMSLFLSLLPCRHCALFFLCLPKPYFSIGTPPSTTQSNPLTTSTSNSEEGHDICGTSAGKFHSQKKGRIFSVKNPDFISIPISGMKPDPNNCNGYYVCVPDGKGDWILHHGDCPVGLHFDAKALFCNWPSQAHCQPTAKQAQTISKFTCPGEGWFSDGKTSKWIF